MFYPITLSEEPLFQVFIFAVTVLEVAGWLATTFDVKHSNKIKNGRLVLWRLKFFCV